MDAPNHFVRGKWSVDQIPASHLIAEGIRVDIRKHVEKDTNYTMKVSDLKEWEEENGNIPDGAILLMYTGWGRNYGKPFYIRQKGVKTFPGISGDAAKWLVKERNIVGIGTDAISIDGPTFDFPAHIVFAEANIYNLENVANMDKLSGPKGFIISAMPMKIAGGSGGPARIFAFKSAATRTSTSISLVVMLIFFKNYYF